MKNIISILIVFLLFSCSRDNEKLYVDVSTIDINNINIKRYGRDLFAIDPDNIKTELDALSAEYYFFLGGNLDDTLSIIQIKSYITDPNLVEISDACNEKYPNFDRLNNSFTDAFKHCKYYFPDQIIPSVYSYISGLDFDYPVRSIDTVMIIALDMYLGKDSKFYKQLGLPLYRTTFFDEDYIVVDCMRELGLEKISFDVSDKNLLELMVHNGKILYFVDAMLPELSDDKKVKFTKEQLHWCKKSEFDIWSMLIDQQLLFTKDMSITNKFLNDGPFTPGLSKESPSRIGQWLGWQLVRSYMNNNDVSLQELLDNNNAQEILAKSSYKPAR